MKTIQHDVVIHAPRQAVWDVLTDFPAHATWNPFLTFDQGSTSLGDRLRVHVKPPGSRGASFTPTLTACAPAERYGWHGRVVLPGIFDGHHEFVLEDSSDGTRVIQREEFSGLLVPLLGRTIARTREGFEQMNLALKEQVETRVRGA